MSKHKRILGKTPFFPFFFFFLPLGSTCGLLQQLLADLSQFSLRLQGGFSFVVAISGDDMGRLY